MSLLDKHIIRLLDRLVDKHINRDNPSVIFLSLRITRSVFGRPPLFPSSLFRYTLNAVTVGVIVWAGGDEKRIEKIRHSFPSFFNHFEYVHDWISQDIV